MILEHSGPTSEGAEFGREWGELLKKYITKPTGEYQETAKEVIDFLKANFDGIEVLKAEFTLYGYMVQENEVCLWNGKADAIAWYKNQYVIVEWKTVSEHFVFRDDNMVYNEYLHQCLVYSRLLQLHLNLVRLPRVIIVTIRKNDGIIAGYFKDFPEECEDKFEEYEWSKEIEKTKRLSLPKGMVKDEIEVGLVAKGEKIRNVFNSECTVEQFVAALGFDELNICAQ